MSMFIAIPKVMVLFVHIVIDLSDTKKQRKRDSLSVMPSVLPLKKRQLTSESRFINYFFPFVFTNSTQKPYVV